MTGCLIIITIESGRAYCFLGIKNRSRNYKIQLQILLYRILRKDSTSIPYQPPPPPCNLFSHLDLEERMVPFIFTRVSAAFRPAGSRFSARAFCSRAVKPVPWAQLEDDKLPHDTKELVLDRGFNVAQTNAFGQTFRDFDAQSERKRVVEEFYRMNRIHQTYDFVQKMREEYGKLNRVEMSTWECCELLNEFVDESDPDLDEPQIEHLLQSAEAIRKDYPDEDWLHLTALIHDLGKVLLHPSFGQLPQWAVVGDTFPVGCAFDESNVHYQYFKENPDYYNSKYNTKYGVYSEGCGLDSVFMSWGHDDYMYLVAKENGTTLPSAGLFVVRYHSFYPLHKHGAYRYLLNAEDEANMHWLKIFNKYDLYSKSKVRVDVAKVKPYYLSLINKYFPPKLKW